MKTFFELREETISEVPKGDIRSLKNWDDRNRRGHEARAYIEVEKGDPLVKEDDGITKDEMGYMDKLISKIKGMHITSFEGSSGAPASIEFYGKQSSLEKFAKDRKIQQIAKKYKSKPEIYLNDKANTKVL